MQPSWDLVAVVRFLRDPFNIHFMNSEKKRNTLTWQALRGYNQKRSHNAG